MAYAPDKIRNVMLAGHSGSGKTTLAEALMYITKSTDRLGTIADGNTVSDFDPEEIRRKASISTALAPFEYKECHVNLIDVPGLFDFELGNYEGIKAADSVIISISARSGVAVGTHKAFKIAKRNNKAKMFFIGKMAMEHADFFKVFDALKEQFGNCVCPVMMPITEEGKPTVYVDLLQKKAFTYNNGVETEVQMPKSNERMDQLLLAINEAVAETDDALMDKFFNDEPFTDEEIVKAVRSGVKSGIIAPVVCGDSTTLEGMIIVLEAIRKMLPSPADVGETVVEDMNGNETKVSYDPDGPLVAYVFKTVADPFVGKLSYVKVLSGKLTTDAPLINSRSEEHEKAGKLLFLKGKKQIETKEISAGDVGAITKLVNVKTGDTLCHADKLYKASTINFPKPSMTMAITTKIKGDEGKIATALQKLIDEDPTLHYKVDSETVQQVISGLGEQHLDVVASKLKSKFGVEIELTPPRVAFKETIRAKAEAEGKHKKQSGGAGQYGVVQIRFEPLTDGTDFEFVNAVVGGVVPKEYIPAVEKGLRDAMKHGVLAGYPMTGIRATLFDGKYHPVDSKEVAFKSAARLAYKAACAQAKPAILEPLGTLKAMVPDANTGDIMGEINKRRGRVLGMNPSDEEGLQLVEAEVPMSEMHDFTTYMRSSTQGRGKYTLEFSRYEPLPANLEAKVIEDAKDLREAEEE
ncbi:MAG: elongation factor G [Oscillospiraceae bacterium]